MNAGPHGLDRTHARVVIAASLGAMFEWYDFFVYGAVAVLLSQHFFAHVNETTSFIFALLGFAAGFAVRPLGAIIFGRLGDLTGRKKTFLITIVLMGVATALIGVLPTYAQIGVAAPIALVGLRLVQGLALGGEYGGAATYVAEHAPPGQRGYYTSWIQLAGSLGFVLALLVVLICRVSLGEQFDSWGWRLPFLLSLVLLAISVYIRVHLEESPVFKAMQSEGKTSKDPLGESSRWGNLKTILLALFGLMAGQTVIAYVSLVYAMFFLSKTLQLDATRANFLIVAALVLASPLYPVFGRLSDRIGRKPVFMAGILLGTLTLFPIFKALTWYTNPAFATAQQAYPVIVVADPDECSFQFDPVGTARFTTSCDVAKSALAAASIPYSNEVAPRGGRAHIRVGNTGSLDAFDGSALAAAEFKTRTSAFRAQLSEALIGAGYPRSADLAKVNYPVVLLLLTVLAAYAILTYAPVAAWLVELFPPRIRYTSMSLPYHVGVGWFGGFLPSIAFAITAYTGDIYSGLWYPVVVATITLVVGTLFVRETKGIAAED